MLWDRGEGDGWAHHVTSDPPADTPSHRVLLHAAVGDFQVTTYQADVLARTIGASAHKPRPRPVARSSACRCSASPRSARPIRRLGDRLLGQRPPRTEERTAPLENKPPREGSDPHGAPRATSAARRQKAGFLLTGDVVDVCGGQPCRSDAGP